MPIQEPDNFVEHELDLGICLCCGKQFMTLLTGKVWAGKDGRVTTVQPFHYLKQSMCTAR